MPDPHIERVSRIHGVRMVGDGLPAGDLAASQRLSRWEEWFPFWADRANLYERLAREALALGRRRSAGELFWLASLAYHYAQFLWFHDLPTRADGQRRRVELYREGGPLFAPPAERFDLSFEQGTIPGYLRLPPSSQGGVPVVLLLGGLESTKEESYLFENRCLARGLATCAFDGPGQGEAHAQFKLRPDFHRFTSAVVDWLETRAEVDRGRIGVVGRSLGGYYAVHSAAHEPRLRACVVWGVYFDLSYYDAMDEHRRRGYAMVAGYDDPAEADPYLRRAIDLAGHVERVRCPVYAVHGGRDELIPASHVDRLREGLKHNPNVTFDVIPEGDHCCHNLYHVVRPRMVDWLAERLGGER